MASSLPSRMPVVAKLNSFSRSSSSLTLRGSGSSSISNSNSKSMSRSCRNREHVAVSMRARRVRALEDANAVGADVGVRAVAAGWERHSHARRRDDTARRGRPLGPRPASHRARVIASGEDLRPHRHRRQPVAAGEKVSHQLRVPGRRVGDLAAPAHVRPRDAQPVRHALLPGVVARVRVVRRARKR